MPSLRRRHRHFLPRRHRRSALPASLQTSRPHSPSFRRPPASPHGRWISSTAPSNSAKAPIPSTDVPAPKSPPSTISTESSGLPISPTSSEDAHRAIAPGPSASSTTRSSLPGRPLWVECRRVPVYNKAGVATHLRGMTSDITSRKLDEEELAAIRSALPRPRRPQPPGHLDGPPAAASPTPTRASSTTSASPWSRSAGLGWLHAFYKRIILASSKPGPTPSPPAPSTTSKPA